jgi:hypothetical protein
MKKFLISFLCLSLWLSASSAISANTEIGVKGQVKDAKGEPLIGVNVWKRLIKKALLPTLMVTIRYR